jgi:hypothetical protein
LWGINNIDIPYLLHELCNMDYCINFQQLVMGARCTGTKPFLFRNY